MKGGGSSHSNYTRKIVNTQINKSSRDLFENNDDCDIILFLTELQNIQPSIINYKINDCLSIELDEKDNLVVIGEFGVLGYITSLSAPQLVNCMKKRKKFIATIMEIDNSLWYVNVKVSSKY